MKDDSKKPPQRRCSRILLILTSLYGLVYRVLAAEMCKGFFMLVEGLTASADKLHPGLSGFTKPLLKKALDIAVSAHLNNQIQQLMQFANGIYWSTLWGRRGLIASPWVAFRGSFGHVTLSSFHGFSVIPGHPL